MPEEFSKKTVKKFGARGAIAFEQEEKTTDLDDLEARVETTAVPFCECGAPILTDPSDVFRCVECELLCCQRCRITLSRYNYCPMCARRAFGLDKRTYLSLIFLQHNLMSPDDLIEVTTHEGEVIEIAIDTTADALVEHGYLTDEGGLSPAGKEAIAVGQQVYGDDGDIQAVKEKIRLQEVVDQ